ncbi:UPF0187 protein At3g61320, chloroplastic [Selaginella moellendorffii]|nr:UPF0187 protein At3g61320, chloroplastic [Selaginella moellendorffii]|eukprot:XP_002965156.2 UPF0187 protein At3g61320, chloroplastic [Selaginella moellendorffii]
MNRCALDREQRFPPAVTRGRGHRQQRRFVFQVFCQIPDPRQWRGPRGKIIANPFSLDGIREARLDIFRWIASVPEWADAQKEQNMPNRRAFYSNNDWLRHRSSLRHARHMASTFSSRVIISLIPPVFTVTGISVLVTLYNALVESRWAPGFLPVLHAPSLPYELTAPALALLLVFRTDTSYSRYDEARKTWTEVISSTKNLARLTEAWIHNDDLMRYIVAFPLALKCHLIMGSDMEAELRKVLDERDLAFVLNAKHRPNCLLQMIFQIIDGLSLGETQQVLLHENISTYNRSVSVCERLIRTPIPLSYTRLTSRFLILWHLGLPIALWDTCNWLVIPSTFFSSAALFCIEEVGVLIEEPFPMLALDRMCEVALLNIKEMTELHAKVGRHIQTQPEEQQQTNGRLRT